MKFGDNLKKLRKSKNLSQEELADKVKVSRQSVSKWETGEAYPEMNNILQLCKIFNCPINSLVNDNMIDLDSLDEEIKMSVVKFKEDKQKKMKGLSKAIYIIARIIKVVIKIGIVGMAVSMIAAPIATSNIKVDNNQIKVFGEKIDYERTDTSITFSDKNDELRTFTDEDEVEAVGKVLDYIEENNMTRVTIIAEFVFVCLEVVLVLTHMIFTKLDKLFTNIYNGDTPFTMENVGYIKKISCLMIATLVFNMLASGFSGLLIENGIDFSVELKDVLYILILFSLSYIFEYGYYIQQDSNGKMYGEADE